MVNTYLLLALLQTGVGFSFLLTNSSNAGLTSYEFQHLSQLIFNEEQSRHHVENEVNSIEYRVRRLEDEMNLKFEQHLKNVTASLVQQLDQHIKSSDYIRHAFEKEKSNRRQLEQDYSEIEMKFQNLSLAYDDLTTEFNKLKRGLADDQTEIVSNKASITSNSARMTTLLANLAALSTNVSSSNAAIENLQRKAGYQSAFAVLDPKAKTSRTIIFEKVVSNIGGHYNTSSGHFTCFYDGIYVFQLNLYKELSATKARCEIHKNGRYIIWVDARPPSQATNDYHEASNSVVVHLNQGDVILIECTDESAFDSMTSFTGFLLYPD